MKTQQKHLIILFTLLACLLGWGNERVMAYTVTIGVFDSNIGDIRYSADGGGLQGPVSGDGTATISVNHELRLKVAFQPGYENYTFVGWTKSNTPVSTNNGDNVYEGGDGLNYYFTITENITLTPVFMNLWSGTVTNGTYQVSRYGTGISVTKVGGSTATYDGIGDLKVTSGTVTIEVTPDTGGVIYIAGMIAVEGGTLIVKKMNAVGGSTLKRHSSYGGSLFRVHNMSSVASTCKLELQGYEAGGVTSNMTISGGLDTYDITYDAATQDYSPYYTHGSDYRPLRPALIVEGGTVVMDRVEIVKNWNKTTDGGAISVTTNVADGHQSNSESIVTLKNSRIQMCVSKYSGAAISIDTRNEAGVNSFGNSEISLENVTINDCFATDLLYKERSDVQGGVIRATSGSTCTLSMKDCTIYNNYTHNRGILSWSSTGVSALQLDNCSFYDNWSKISGAALELEADAEITGGSIYDNTAKSNGGGIWLHGGSLTTKGALSITGNSAVGGNGGGVYYQSGSMTINGSSLTVTGNTSGAAKTTVSDNVYLPSGQTIAVGSDATASGINIGVYTQNAATVGTDIPVLTGDASDLADVYDALLLKTAYLTDDRNVPQRPKYTSADLGRIYFTLTRFDFGPYNKPFAGPISNADSLYKFMCWVNGVNGFASTHASQGSNVTADIDMSGIEYWIPIGELAHYTGTFDGKGHVIKGLPQNSLSYDCTNFGLFGTTEGATIQDVFLEGCNYTKSSAGNMGTLIGLMKGGTVKNCIGSGSQTGSNASCIIGGLVGKVEKNGGAAATVHSSSAMAMMTGYQMGGLVGDLAADCNLYNSFANPQFTYSGSGTEYVGGLVGVNNGTVENCYSRVRGTVPAATYFGWLVGDNTSGTLNHSYIPASASTNYTATSKTGTQNNLDTYTPVVAPYLYNHSNDNMVVTTSETLCNELNDWVVINNETPGQPACALWKRTMAGGTAYSATAGDINGDYPIHQYTGYTCVASPDGITLDYAPHLYNILKRHTSDATVNLYANDTTKASTGTNVVVYIDENVSLLQDVSGSKTRTSAIEAYTCQTLPGDPRSWHFISSSLSNSGIGFEYNQNAGFNWDSNPCHVNISENNDVSLFPSDLPKVGGFSDVSRIDLYTFYEPEYHWINLKRNSASHWHMNATTAPITYTNETTLTPGKGYLISIDQDQLLQNKGTLNNGEVSVDLDYTPDQAWAGLVGYNLIGNPYQSYLDFSAFVSQNSSLWYDKSKGREVEPTYAVYDDAMGGYIQYKQGASRGARTASGTLNMHQGFMVRSSGATRAKFTNAMRTDDGTGVSFRGEQPAFPLINLTVTDSEGVNDFAVLELGRDTDAGAEKLRANDCKGWLYLRHNGDDYGILFRSEVDGYQPLWFEAEEAGTYTMRWETANGEFESLTLVDNITGVVTDMLATDSYTFEANPDQYASRFKMVIGDYKDIEENEGGASTGSTTETFAYYANGEIHLVETQNFASLQIVDMTGRVILSRDGVHTISTNGIVPGVYVLRLTTDKGTKIQKMVIE